MVLQYINMNPPWVYTCSPSWTPLPPPSPYHPSGSSQCTSPKHPVSCIEPGLAIHFLYDIRVSMPFSQIIPPSPSPTESKRLFYTSVSLLLSQKTCCCSVAKSCPALWDHMDWSTPGFPVLQSPGVCSSSCPSSWWCHSTISSSVIPFSSCLPSFPASESFPMSRLFASGG